MVFANNTYNRLLEASWLLTNTSRNTFEASRLLTLLTLLTNPYHAAHSLLTGPYHEGVSLLRYQPPQPTKYILYIYIYILYI